MYFNNASGITALVFDSVPMLSRSPGAIRALASQIGPAWANFARHGDPNHGGLPKWPSYTLNERATMIFDFECRVEKDPWREERLAWDGIR